MKTEEEMSVDNHLIRVKAIMILSQWDGLELTDGVTWYPEKAVIAALVEALNKKTE